MTALGSPQTSLFSVTEIPLPPKSESGSLASQAMLCRLCISQWDGYKYDREVSEEIANLHNAEKDAGRYRKRLLPRSVLQPITKAIGLARRQHAFHTLPWGDDDYRILPAAAYLDHRNAMQELKNAFLAAVSRLEGRFEQLVIHQNGLGTMFKVEDYPGMRDLGGKLVFQFPRELTERFSFETKVLPMPDVSDFRADVGDQERERIRRQITESVNAALRLGTREIWQRLYEPVSHMAECMAEFNAAGNRNAGVIFDIAMTRAVFERYIEVPKAFAGAQDMKGRYWDLLFMFRLATKKNSDGEELLFEFLSIPNGSDTWANERMGASPEQRLVQLKAIADPGDRGEPCLTFMLPCED